MIPAVSACGRAVLTTDATLMRPIPQPKAQAPAVLAQRRMPRIKAGTPSMARASLEVLADDGELDDAEDDEESFMSTSALAPRSRQQNLNLPV